MWIAIVVVLVGWITIFRGFQSPKSLVVLVPNLTCSLFWANLLWNSEAKEPISCTGSLEVALCGIRSRKSSVMSSSTSSHVSLGCPYNVSLDLLHGTKICVWYIIIYIQCIYISSSQYTKPISGRFAPGKISKPHKCVRVSHFWGNHWGYCSRMRLRCRSFTGKLLAHICKGSADKLACTPISHTFSG